MALTRDLGGFVADLSFQNLPPEAIEVARTGFIDTIATMTAGAHDPAPQLLRKRHVADQLRPRSPKLAVLMDDSEHDVLAYMAFPTQHRTKLHSTNPLERLNKGGQATGRCRRHLSQRGQYHPADRRRPARTERRVAAPVPLYADRRQGRTYTVIDRRRSCETSTPAA